LGHQTTSSGQMVTGMNVRQGNPTQPSDLQRSPWALASRLGLLPHRSQVGKNSGGFRVKSSDCLGCWVPLCWGQPPLHKFKNVDTGFRDPTMAGPSRGWEFPPGSTLTWCQGLETHQRHRAALPKVSALVGLGIPRESHMVIPSGISFQNRLHIGTFHLGLGQDTAAHHRPQTHRGGCRHTPLDALVASPAKRVWVWDSSGISAHGWQAHTSGTVHSPSPTIQFCIFPLKKSTDRQ